MSDLATNGGHLVLKDGHLLKDDCICCEKWCISTWESIWNCATSAWGSPTLVSSLCQFKPTVFYTWQQDPTNPCRKVYTDVRYNCTDISVCGDGGIAPAVPTGPPMTTCCPTCVGTLGGYNLNYHYDFNGLGAAGDPSQAGDVVSGLYGGCSGSSGSWSAGHAYYYPADWVASHYPPGFFAPPHWYGYNYLTLSGGVWTVTIGSIGSGSISRAYGSSPVGSYPGTLILSDGYGGICTITGISIS